MIVLASASPRRQELLRSAGISFVVEAADVDETPRAGETARDCAERLAREKALTVWRKRPQDVVLGADTVVTIDEQILGKPVDADDAARMLRMLSGRTHEVITGVAVVKSSDESTFPRLAEAARPFDLAPGRGGAPQLEVASEVTLVTMNELSEDEIREYVVSGEPMDKAGAYAIQGMAGRWIPRIEGDYSNVVGLPVALVYGMLRNEG